MSRSLDEAVEHTYIGVYFWTMYQSPGLHKKAGFEKGEEQQKVLAAGSVRDECRLDRA